MVQGSHSESGNRGQQVPPVESGHTPTPWIIVPEERGWLYQADWLWIMREQTRIARVVVYTESPAEHCANAAFIVRAVNSHDALVKALEDGKIDDDYPIKVQRVLQLAVNALRMEGYATLAAELDAVATIQSAALEAARSS